MEKYETSKIYVVKPSIVIGDKCIKKYNETKNEDNYKEVVEFQNNSKDIDIAISSGKSTFVYKSLFNYRDYYKVMLHSVGSNQIYHVDEWHVGIFKNDIMLLAEYLYMKSVSNHKWTEELEKYIISLKPYYDFFELIEIYNQIESEESEKNVKTIKLTNSYKKAHHRH